MSTSLGQALYRESRWWPWTPEAISEVPPTYQRWHGSVAMALAELNDLVSTGQGDEEVIWHPSRITAALLRASMGQPRVASVRQVTAFTQKLFMGTATPEDVAITTATAASHDILDSTADQVIDGTSLIATNPDLAHQAALRLHERQQGKGVLMIPLGNSGFTAGVMTALEYQALGENNVHTYPLRFSQKSGNWDSRPKINADEIAHIGEQAVGRTIVVADEDSISGKRIVEAIEHLRLILPPGQELIGLTTLDRRTGEARQAQGDWWQHRDPRLAEQLAYQAKIDRQVAEGTYNPYKNYR